MTTVAKDNNAQIERLALGSFGTNCYIVTCPKTKVSAVVDAPAEAGTILKTLEGTDVKYILMTHHHMDHTGALAELRSKLEAPVAANDADAGNLPVKPEISLNDDDILSVGELQIKVIHTPGHTPGGVCFYFSKYLISGDTVFNAGPGRTNSPAALKQIIESITAKIFILPDDTQVFPGHGESTNIGKEKGEYAVFAAKSHDPNLCGDIVWLES